MKYSEDIETLLGPVPPSGSSTAPPDQLLVPPGSGGEQAMGAHDGADRFSKALGLWSPLLNSADSDILPEKDLIDARSLDMGRNDAYIAGGATLHQDNIVGSMFVLNSKPMTKLLFGKEDEVFEEEFQEEVEDRFDLYAESLDNWIDDTRTQNFTELVRLAVGIDVFAGEVLATAEWRKEFGRPFSTSINMVDVARLSTPQDKLVNLFDDSVRAGVERNSRGVPIAYHIRMRHPSDAFTPEQFMWKRVEARKPWGRPQVIHIHNRKRPDQTRGISDMVTGLKEMKIARQVRDHTLQRIAAQAIVAATITSELPSETVFTQLGGGQMKGDDYQKIITAYAEGYLGSIAQYTDAAKNLRLDGVKIPHLYPGTKLDMTSPAGSGPIGTEFEQSLLRYLAAAFGVSYEQFSRDYTKTNYSSARAAIAETEKYMSARKRRTADRFASMIYRLWLEEAINKGVITSLPRAARQPGWLYEAQRLDAISKCDWIGASRGQIDEWKETQAAALRIEAGLSTHEDELARLGKDFRKVFRQRKREQKLMDKLGLVFSGTHPTGVNDAGNEEQRAAA